MIFVDGVDIGDPADVALRDRRMLSRRRHLHRRRHDLRAGRLVGAPSPRSSSAACRSRRGRRAARRDPRHGRGLARARRGARRSARSTSSRRSCTTTSPSSSTSACAGGRWCCRSSSRSSRSPRTWSRSPCSTAQAAAGRSGLLAALRARSSRGLRARRGRAVARGRTERISADERAAPSSPPASWPPRARTGASSAACACTVARRRRHRRARAARRWPRERSRVGRRRRRADERFAPLTLASRSAGAHRAMPGSRCVVPRWTGSRIPFKVRSRRLSMPPAAATGRRQGATDVRGDAPPSRRRLAGRPHATSRTTPSRSGARARRPDARRSARRDVGRSAGRAHHEARAAGSASSSTTLPPWASATARTIARPEPAADRSRGRRAADEALEDPLAQLGRHARPVVLHLEHDLAVVAAHRDADARARRRVADRRSRSG